MKECHLCEFCDEQYPEKEKLILHLKSHLIGSSFGLKQTKIPNLSVQSKTPGHHRFLRKGFYHPTIKQADSFVEKKAKQLSVFKTGTSKSKTQYYIYKEKGQVKKVIKTVFKPKVPREKSVRDELSSNLDDLLKTFEDEDEEPQTIGIPSIVEPEPRTRGIYLVNVQVNQHQ